MAAAIRGRDRIGRLLDFSASRSALLVSCSVNPANAPPLWAVPVPAGTARRVGEVSAWDASWSRDGRNLAFVTGTDLYVAKSDGGDAKLLAKLPG